MIPKKDVHSTPREGGVYFLYNIHKELLYIGRSKDLYKRLKKHKEYKIESYEWSSLKPFYYYRYTIIGNKCIRDNWEKELIKELKPVFNDVDLIHSR